MSLFSPSIGFKPFRYPQAYEYWLRQQNQHWTHQEFNLDRDVVDFKAKLTGPEKLAVTQILRFFVQSDIDVHKNYMLNYSGLFKAQEVRWMLSAFENMETIHIMAYAHLIETLGLPDSDYTEFLKHKQMLEKHLFMEGTEDYYKSGDYLIAIGIYTALVEGMQLFASFAMLLRFSSKGFLQGTGQIISLSIKDESLHCEGMSWLFKEIVAEKGIPLSAYKDKLIKAAEIAISLEDAFLDLVFAGLPNGSLLGTTVDEYKSFIRYICNYRLQALGFPGLLFPEHNKGVFEWLSVVDLDEHANFFEVSSVEYHKSAAVGLWGTITW